MGVNTGRGLGAGADTTNAPDVTKVCSSVSVRASRQARMLRRSTKLKQPIPLGWSPLYANQNDLFGRHGARRGVPVTSSLHHLKAKRDLGY
ncbi:hypothetical protein DY000_02038714 [Brassica cretica]|uniref:Uncharacterized protein n=1 Tax=Brassica cretica TaxID=69181 RepID=A0ABQ7BE93_BRACR|nr:hypothetical protein DY000_02038714 [Brassica cretica]